MFTVDCSNYGTNYADDDGIPGGACSNGASSSVSDYGDSGVKMYECYDEYNTMKCDWNDGHCCDHYDNEDSNGDEFYIDKSTCTNCLCLDPDKTTIRGTYLHQGQVTSNLKLYLKLLQF